MKDTTPTSDQKVEGLCAANVVLGFETRWGRGKCSLGVMSCLMYGRRTSSTFWSSTTRRICTQNTHQLAAPERYTKTRTYVDGPEASPVTSRHVLVEALHRRNTRELAELLVHVVCAGAGVVAQPDAEVLHFQRLLFVDLTSPTRK